MRRCLALTAIIFLTILLTPPLVGATSATRGISSSERSRQILLREVVINEFVATPTGMENIELYNTRSYSINLKGWRIEVSIGASPNVLVIEEDYLLAPHSFVKVRQFFPDWPSSGKGWIPNYGATITLYDSSDAKQDEVSYGIFGPAPAPPYRGSTARVSDGYSSGEDTYDWNVCFSPTLGSSNNGSVADVKLGESPVVLNELYPGDDADHTNSFVELYNKGTSTVDLDGWRILCVSRAKGSDYVELTAYDEISAKGFFVVPETRFPDYFVVDFTYTCVYLLNDEGERVDQVLSLIHI